MRNKTKQNEESPINLYKLRLIGLVLVELKYRMKEICIYKLDRMSGMG